MACATPVIASSLATSALTVIEGEEVIVADTPKEWANAILDLIHFPEKQTQIGGAGRRYVEKNHQWSRIAHKLENIYKKTIGDPNIG